MFSKFKIGTIAFALAILLTARYCYSQKKEAYIEPYDASKKFSVQVYGTYISSSSLQNDPKSLDPFESNNLVDFKGGYGYGVELDYKPTLWNLDLTFFLSTEYFHLNENDLVLQFQQDTSFYNVSMSDNFYMVPIELGAKWDLPVSTNSFKIYIGGGAGVYLGDKTRTLGGFLQTHATSRKPGFSVNILTGLQYYLARNLCADLELKFREGWFDVQSSYDVDFINVRGTTLSLDNPSYNRIIVDGVRISLGLKYNF